MRMTTNRSMVFLEAEFALVFIIVIPDLTKASASIRSKYTARSFTETLIFVKFLDSKENCTSRKISIRDQRDLKL